MEDDPEIGVSLEDESEEVVVGPVDGFRLFHRLLPSVSPPRAAAVPADGDGPRPEDKLVLFGHNKMSNHHKDSIIIVIPSLAATPPLTL